MTPGVHTWMTAALGANLFGGEMGRFWWRLIILSISVTVACGIPPAWAEPPRPLVVVLASDGYGHRWSSERLEGLSHRIGGAADVVVEYLGLDRGGGVGRFQTLKLLLRIKYAGMTPAAVITLDDDALAFLLDRRERLFEDVPLVANRIPGGDALNIVPGTSARLVASAEERFDAVRTIRLAEKAQPRLKRLIVINPTDSGLDGALMMREFRRQIRGSVPAGLEVVYWENLPSEVLEGRLRRLSGHDAVILLSHGPYRLSDTAIAASQAPIHTVWGTYGDTGVVGGCVIDGVEQGGAIGRALIGAGVLAGADGAARGGGASESASREGGVTWSTPVCRYGFEALRALGLDPALIEDSAEVVGRPPGWLPGYRAFPALYWTAGMASLGLAALITGLLLRLSTKDQVGRRAEELARRHGDELRAFRDMLDETRDCVFVFDAETLKFIYANRGAVELSGYTAEELADKTPIELQPDFTPETFSQLLAPLWAGEKPSRRFQTRHRQADGRDIPVDVQIQHIPPRDGRSGRFIAIVRDITDTRETEAALRQSEERFELALTASADGIWDWELRTGRIWFSARWKAQLGYSDSDFENSLDAWKRVLHSDDLVDLLRRVADYTNGRIDSFNAVYRHRHKNGHTVYIQSRAVHQRDADGRVVRLVGSHTDITERQISQERLRESERRLRDLAAAVPGMVFQWIERWDGGHGFTWVSPRAREIFGVDASELTADWTRMRIHPEDLDLWRVSLETAAASGIDWEFEGRCLRGEGGERWWKGLARPVSGPDGVVFNGIILDITSERMMREETDRLRNRLDFLLNASPAIICATSADGRHMSNFISAGIQRFGYRPPDLLRERDWWLPRVHAEDRETVMATLDDVRRLDAVELAYRFRDAEGKWRWIADHRVMVRDAEGRPIEIVGTMTDVTGTVEAERAARLAQRRLELVLESAGEGIYGVDVNGLTIFSNAAAQRMTGFTGDQLLDTPSHPLFHHSREDGTPHPVDECPVTLTLADGRERIVVDDVFWRADGSCFPVEFVVTPMVAGAGDDTEGAVVVFRDVTAARTVARELRRSVSRLEAVLAHSPVGIAIVGRDRRFIKVNDYFAELMGYATDWFVGRATRSLYMGDLDFETVGRDGYPEALRGGVFKTEIQLRRRDGTAVWTSVSGSGIDSGDVELGVVWVVEDITARKAHEMALREKTVELERSNAELEAFAYVASHDLRQPLRVVNSYLKLLERGLGDKLDADSKEFIDFARSGAQRMDRLIVDLLEYSRVGRRSKPSAPHDLGGLLAFALRGLEFAIEDSGGVVEVAPGPWPEVNGDDSELERLLQNLIGNALKYHAPGRPPRVVVSVTETPEGCEVSVADNGIGIAENQLERVFGIFQRLHASDAYEGSGIGLAICRKIVERHGGRIWVESVVGEGSVFKFTLPTSKIGVDDDKPAHE